MPNWGQTIFQSAREMDSNIVFRQRIEEYQSKVGEEREWWDRKKASIQEGFMKELEYEESSKKTTTQSSTTAGSDDDAVLVEAGDPAVTGTETGSPSGKKKKKGKK